MLSPTGEDLGSLQRIRVLAPDIPVPPQLALVVETAAALSVAVPLPYVRVDLCGAGADGVVPGGADTAAGRLTGAHSASCTDLTAGL